MTEQVKQFIGCESKVFIVKKAYQLFSENGLLYFSEDYKYEGKWWVPFKRATVYYDKHEALATFLSFMKNTKKDNYLNLSTQRMFEILDHDYKGVQVRELWYPEENLF